MRLHPEKVDGPTWSDVVRPSHPDAYWNKGCLSQV